MTGWRQWVHHPEKLRIRNVLFQIHLVVGTFASLYVVLMSLSGSMVVWQAELYKAIPIAWLVKAHDNLMAGSTGRMINGFGGCCLVVLCLTGAVIWWPGVQHWKRSLKVDWRARFPRLNWDLHSAVGFWGFLFVLIWGLSGIYFGFPEIVNPLLRLDRADRYTDTGLFALSQLHFGRFGWVSKIVWSIVGWAPAVLALTGVFICCRRIIFHKPSNPKHAGDSDV